MNTQNVNVKTATKESTERWVENFLANAISEQKSLLLHLVELKNKRLRESERSELVWGTLMRMADAGFRQRRGLAVVQRETEAP